MVINRSRLLNSGFLCFVELLDLKNLRYSSKDLRKRCINLHSIKKIQIKEGKDPQKFHLDLSRSFFFPNLHEKGSFSSFHPTPNCFVTPSNHFCYKVTCQDHFSGETHSIQFRVTHLSCTTVNLHVHPLPRILTENPKVD